VVNENIAILSIVAKMQDNSKEIAENYNAMISKVEKNTDGIALKLNDKQIKKKLGEIEDMLDDGLKGIDVSKQFADVVHMLNDTKKSVKEYRDILSGVTSEMNEIVDISKRIKNLDKFSSSEISNFLKLNRELTTAKKSYEEIKKTASSTATQTKNSFSVDSLGKARGLFATKKLTHTKGAEIASQMNIASDSIKPSDVLNFRDYGDLINLFIRLQEEKKELGEINTVKDIEKHLENAKHLQDVYNQIILQANRLKSQYGDSGLSFDNISIEKAFPKVTQESLTKDVTDLVGKLIAKLKAPYEKAVINADLAFENAIKHANEKAVKKFQKNVESSNVRIGNLQKKSLKYSDGSSAGAAPNVSVNLLNEKTGEIVEVSNAIETSGTTLVNTTETVLNGLETFNVFLQKLHEASKQAAANGERLAEQAAVFDKQGNLLAKSSGEERRSSISYKEGSDTLFHSHPYNPNGNNLRFSEPDLVTFFEEAVPKGLTKNILYCGEQLLQMDISSVPKDRADDLYDTLLNHMYTVMYKLGNAAFDENGIVQVSNVKLEDFNKEFHDKFIQSLNSMIKSTVEKFGGTFDSYNYDNGIYSANKSAYVDNSSDVAELFKLEQQLLDAGMNFSVLSKDLGRLKMPTDDIWKFVNAITDGKIKLDDIKQNFTQIKASVAAGIPVETIIDDLNKVQKEAAETKTDISAINKGDSSVAESGKPKTETGGHKTSASTSAEIDDFNKLRDKIAEVSLAINKKTAEIANEEQQVDKSVTAEISKFEALRNKIAEIKTELASGFTFEINTTTSNLSLTEIVQNLSPQLIEIIPDADINKWRATIGHAIESVNIDSLLIKLNTLNGLTKSITPIDANTFLPLINVLDRIGTISSLLEELSKLDANLESISSAKSKDLSIDKIKISKKNVEHLRDFATVIELIKNAIADFNAIENINIIEDVFKSVRIKKDVPDRLLDLAVALEVVKESLDKFDVNNQNILTQIGNLSNIGNAVNNATTSANGNVKKGSSSTDTTTNVNAQKSYESIAKKLNSYVNSAMANASNKLTGTQQREFANLSAEINNAVNAIGKYETTTDEAKQAQDEFLKALNIAQINKFEDVITDLSQKLGNLKNNASNKTDGFDSYVNGIEQSINLSKSIGPVDFLSEESVRTFQNRVNEIEESMKRALGKEFTKASSDDIQNFLNKVDKYMLRNTKAAKAYASAFDEIKKKATLGISVQEFDTVKRGYEDLITQIEKAGKAGKTFGDIWKNRFGSLIAYLSTFASFYDIWNKIQEGFQIAVEYDDAVTEMKKVSDETLESLRKFQHESFALGDSVGTTGKQIQSSTSDFMRLGESIEEAAKSALDANTLFKVSEFDSIEEATSALISMSQAYQELEKSDINDILNYVGNNFAISTEGLATGLQKSAAALKTAGNDIYESVALITAGNSIIQDADQVGAGIRTISLRILGTEAAKDELASLGEDVEDFVIQTQSKIDKTVREYTAVASNNYRGVSLLDENGNYRSTYEILQDIADVYQEILETDKKAGTNRGSALIELLAGKNRSNIAASILQSPDLLRDVFETAQTESAGSAQKELEAQLDSISSHLEKLKNQWQAIWVTDYNREAINTVLDLSTAVLGLVESLGLIPSALAAGGGIAFVKYFD